MKNMKDYKDVKPPKVTIADVALPAQEFTWTATAGPLPYVTTFYVMDYQSNYKLQKAQNPVTLKIEIMGGLKEKMELQSLEFKKLWLLEGKQVNQYQYLWAIADNRWSFRGKKIYCSYNKTRAQNYVNLTVSPNTLDPAVVRVPYDTFGSGRYLPWSINKQRGKCYTVLEILYLVLDTLKIDYRSGASLNDKSYVLENIEINGEDIFVGLRYLLSLSRLQMTCDKNGSINLYSLDYPEAGWEEAFFQWIKTLPTSALGGLYKENKQKLRPKKIRVNFEKYMEILVAGVPDERKPDDVYTQNLDLSSMSEKTYDMEKILQRRIIGAVNVIQVPYPIEYENKSYKVDEWMPLEQYLKAYKIQLDWINNLYFSGCLEQRIALQIHQNKTGAPPSDTNPMSLETMNLSALITGRIKQYYRKVYRIDPYFMDRIKRWHTRRCAVIDNYSHYTLPSPLYGDYTVIPYVRPVDLAKKRSTWRDVIYVWKQDEEDPGREKRQPGSIEIVSQAFGIFKVVYPDPIDQTTQTFLPFALVKDSVPKIGAVAGINLLSSAKLDPKHTMETIISVCWDLSVHDAYRPSDAKDYKNKYYLVDVEFPNQTADLEKYEYLVETELARYEWKFDASLEEKPVNKSILEALAVSESAKILNLLKDRYAGYITIAGILHDMLPLAHISSVAWKLDPASGIETIIDMRDPPPMPTLEQTLPQYAISYLRKHVNTSESIAEKPLYSVGN